MEDLGPPKGLSVDIVTEETRKMGQRRAHAVLEKKEGKDMRQEGREHCGRLTREGTRENLHLGNSRVLREKREAAHKPQVKLKFSKEEFKGYM